MVWSSLLAIGNHRFNLSMLTHSGSLTSGVCAVCDAGELVGQVLDEIGIDLSAALGSAPKKRLAQTQAAPAAAATDEEYDGLAARLAGLRS